MSSSTSASNLRRGLVAFACFLIALFVLDRGISLAMRALESRYRGGNDFQRQLASYLASHSFNTLILGTSRTYEGITPTRLEACGTQRIFKEAFQGKGPKYQLYFYRLFKKYAGRPKLVIFGVDYFIYSIESDRRWMSRFTEDEAVEEPGLLGAPLLLQRQKQQNDLFFNHLVDDLTDAAAHTLTPEEALFEKARTYSGVPTKDGNPRLVTDEPPSYLRQEMPRAPGVEGEYFERLLAELMADNVRVALVSLPDYIGSYRTNVEMNLFHQGLRELARRYPNVTVLIYNDPTRFDLGNPAYFLDGGWGRLNSHLSARGAAELSERLCHDLAPLSRP